MRTRVIAATLSDHIKSSDRVFIMGPRIPTSTASVRRSACGRRLRRARVPRQYCYRPRPLLATSLINTFDHQAEYEDMFITPQEAQDLCTQRSLLDRGGYAFDDVCRKPGGLKGDPARRRDRPPPHGCGAHSKCDHLLPRGRMRAPPRDGGRACAVVHPTAPRSTSARATALLAGIMLDTKNFVLKTGVRTSRPRPT